MKELINIKYKHFQQNLNPSIITEKIEETEHKISEKVEISEPSINLLTTANLMSDSKILAQKKKQFFMNDLVKCPHEDHTYAISSNSIAMALQSSNIFNQNNTTDHLNSFLGQVKDVQMNPKLQKILGKVIEENENAQMAENKSRMEKFDNVVGSDGRDCFTCKKFGDDDVCGRLLPFDSYWIHVNCLLWSEDVAVGNESLVDPIESVLIRIKTVSEKMLIFGNCKNKLYFYFKKCCICEKEGATIKCSHENKSCGKSYHFTCAYTSNCIITASPKFSITCFSHNIDENKPPLSNITNDQKLIINLDDDLYTKKKYTRLRFSVNNDSLIKDKSTDVKENNDPFSRIDIAEHSDENPPFILIGSVQVKNLGDLETISDYRTHLCPINFKSSRLYWSTKEIGKKCMYTCRIRHIEAYKREFKNKSNLITSIIDQMCSNKNDDKNDEGIIKQEPIISDNNDENLSPMGKYYQKNFFL